jgi:hypothetical protein
MRLFSGLLILVFSYMSFGYQSSHMQKFSIRQCFADSCLSVEGDTAFLSMNRNFIAGSNAQLHLKKVGSKKETLYLCRKFELDVKKQSIFCDNEMTSKLPSLTVDSKLRVLVIANPQRKIKS